MSLRPLPLLLLAGAMVLWGGAGEKDGVWAQESAAAAGGDDQVTITTDLGGAHELARQALKKGRPDLTISVARQILAVVPNDAAAHMLLAAALTRVGQPDEAAKMAKTGFRLAEVPEAKFEGAYLTAEALAAAGRPFASKFWLRRADAHAESDAAKAVLRQAFGTVSQQTPLSFGVTLFAGPSDNVNGGSLHESFLFMGIPIPIDQALPGWVAGGQLELRYALPANAAISASWAHRSVLLGDKARAIDPGATAGDFTQDDLILGAEKFWSSADQRSIFRLGGEVGRRWSGGDHSADLARAELGYFHVLSDTSGLGARIGVETQHYPDRPVLDSVAWSAGISWREAGPQLGNLALGLGVKEVQSDAAGIAWRGPALTLGWAPPDAGRAIGLSFALSVEQRDYWKTVGFAPDIKLGLSVTAELREIGIMGFNPTVTLSSGRTKSDLVVRDTKELGVSFGLSSSF